MFHNDEIIYAYKLQQQLVFPVLFDIIIAVFISKILLFYLPGYIIR